MGGGSLKAPGFPGLNLLCCCDCAEVSRKFANGSDQEEVGAASDVASSDTSTTVVEHSSVGDDDL